MINKKTLQTLEYDKILNILQSYAVSQASFSKISNISPSNDEKIVNTLLNEVEEAYKIYHIYRLKPLIEFDDILQILEKTKLSAILHFSEFRKIAKNLKSARIAKTSIQNYADEVPNLSEIINKFTLENDLEKKINDTIISDSEISDNASDDLRQIRKKLLSAQQKLREKLQSYCKNTQVSKYLQENLVTMREGRYVIPVKSQYRAEIPGLIHDRSASDATLYIEPFAVVEMNNSIKSLKMDEAAEIEKILKELSAQIAISFDNISYMQKMLIELDVIFSKLHFSVDFDCVKPKINNFGYINLIKSRHPLIDKSKIVPVSISVGKPNSRILMVTGPNTGGKTVVLKTVGLFCLMAYSGLFIPAAETSEIPIFDNIFADIGDEQSIASSLSTFSSHIVNIVNITDNITSNSLALFDELGAGTDPAEGAALAIGIIKYIQNVGTTAIITTHYSELKEYALTSKNIQNASMQFNESTLTPTYRLIEGLPGSSNALKIAKTLKIKDFILQAAYQTIPQKKLEFENILSQAESVRRKSLEELQKIEQEKREVDELKKQLINEKERLDRKLESINLNSKSEINRLVSKHIEEANELIEELKEKLKQQDERALFEAKKLLNKIEDIKFSNENEENISGIYQDINADELKVGDEVFIKSLNVVGKVLEVFHKRKEARVSAGVAVASIKFSNLAKPPSYSNKKEVKKTKNSDLRLASEDFSPLEIKVLGLTVAEAIEQIEPIIDNMSLENGNKNLRIVHGKGTGALKRGIHEYLKRSKQIANFSLAPYGEGDTGVTIVKIK